MEPYVTNVIGYADGKMTVNGAPFDCSSTGSPILHIDTSSEPEETDHADIQKIR